MCKRIFKFIVLVIVLAALASCNSEAAQQQDYVSEDKNSQQLNTKVPTKQDDKIRWHYYKDPENGMVKHRAPVPVSWEISENLDAEIQIKGPNGLIVHKTQTENFNYSHDPYMQQTIRQLGDRLSPVVPLETIVHQHIKPYAEGQGYSYVNGYRMPRIVKWLEEFSSKMPQDGSRRQYDAMGTEWQGTEGTKSFIVVVHYVTSKNSSISWSIQTTELEAPSGHFEGARDAYIYALVNSQVNPQWQQMKNGELRGNNAYWAQKSRESARAHQQRMAAIESWGNTSRSIAKTYSDISDISHAGYLKRSDIISDGHSKTINMIGERTVIGNHGTGEHYNVPAGSKYYWVNNRGEYIATDNSLYDPKIDNSINDAEWTKFNVEQ